MKLCTDCKVLKLEKYLRHDGICESCYEKNIKRREKNSDPVSSEKCKKCGEKYVSTLLSNDGLCSSCVNTDKNSGVKSEKPTMISLDKSYCIKCGALIEKNARFCGKCGSDQVAKTTSVAQVVGKNVWFFSSEFAKMLLAIVGLIIITFIIASFSR